MRSALLLSLSSLSPVSMAPVPFIFPPTLHALEADHDDGRLSAQNPTDVSSLRPSQLVDFVKGVSFHLYDKELFCIEEQDVFDPAYSEDEIWNREVRLFSLSLSVFFDRFLSLSHTHTHLLFTEDR
ncbi:hypothetical protein RHGRI_023822 [Rhododendron griersonianum]|uniref:Uncharacterized protein n=1 Tax=Rhododendron griersonianum TaxID=479676 RepID=A0AAV6J9D7_9ERIC|nr:hypothetical protein RHGRI_023822 [Rhododendron griersonianum]